MKGTVLAFVPVTIGTVETMFVVDSGASVTVLDKAIATSAHLTSKPLPGETKTLGCTIKATLTSVPDWKLGPLKLKAANLPTQGLGFGSAKVAGRPIGGLLGADAQALTKVVTIDYAHSKVTFGGAVPTTGKSVAVNVQKLRTGVAVVAPVKIGATSIHMLIDTGASRTTLSDKTVVQTQLPKVGAAQQVNAAGCPATTQPVRLSHATLGAVAVPNAIVDATAKGSPAIPSAVGLFGSDLLSTYKTITIDYAGSRLILG